MNLTREEMCARIEAALQLLAPGDYKRVDDGSVFLRLSGPNSADITYRCEDCMAYVDFGPAGGEVNEFYDTDDDDITSERVFSATYKKLFIRTGGIFPAEDFEKMKSLKSFVSASWKGTYTFEGISWNGTFTSKAVE